MQTKWSNNADHLILNFEHLKFVILNFERLPFRNEKKISFSLLDKARFGKFQSLHQICEEKKLKTIWWYFSTIHTVGRSDQI